ncbi:MAG: hypothetical protein WEB03_09915 [Nitriliruptor sp.]|uniref:hypothetical protein n=1 Tax=Nitriliruptor sp. TaxID=2448056 RepID=UPI0034A03113
MNRTRAWRTATATLAASALIMMSAAPAAAQSLEDLEGLDPSALEELLDGLDAGQLQELLDQIPDGTPLDDVVQAIQDALGGDDGDGDGDGAGGEGDGTGEAPSVGGPGSEIPETGIGGFSGYADADSLIVFVGLPTELADGLAPVLEGLGIAGSSPVDGSSAQGIRIDLGSVQANLERAAAGEEISSEASAFITNVLLASDAAEQPGACQGGESNIAIPPDSAAPFLTLTLVGVDCEETDERAFANVQFTGLNISLANLVAQGDTEGAFREGLDQVIDPLNEGLSQTNQLLCPVLDGLGLTADNCATDAPILQVENPLDLDVPLLDLDLATATAEVTQDGESITATATATVTGLNVLGVGCADQVHTSTATSDGSTATRSASATPLTGATCNTEQQLLQLLLDGTPIGDIGIVDSILQDDTLDGALTPVFDGIDDLADALSTIAVSGGQANLGDIEGAGTSASTSPFVIVRTLAFSELDETPLGDIEVVVVGGATEVGVNAVPAGITPPAPPQEPVTPSGPTTPVPANLPRTGAGAAALFGLAALGAAAGLRRRNG